MSLTAVSFSEERTSVNTIHCGKMHARAFACNKFIFNSVHKHKRLEADNINKLRTNRMVLFFLNTNFKYKTYKIS